METTAPEAPENSSAAPSPPTCPSKTPEIQFCNLAAQKLLEQQKITKKISDVSDKSEKYKLIQESHFLDKKLL